MNELQLRDIHLPEHALWWPPAPGWWLAAILLVVLLASLPWLIRLLKRKSPRRYSLRELDRIRASYAAGEASAELLTRVSSLLRRIVISYHGRERGAAATGEDWLRQLEQMADGFDAEQLRWLTRDRYRPGSECDIEALLRSCETWIRALPRRAHVAD